MHLRDWRGGEMEGHVMETVDGIINAVKHVGVMQINFAQQG